MNSKQTSTTSPIERASAKESDRNCTYHGNFYDCSRKWNIFPIHYRLQVYIYTKLL